MKKELSAAELGCILEEIKGMSDSKVDKIYQPNKDELLIQLHKTGIGKKVIRIKGKFIHLTEHKPENPMTPFGFCTYLRKKLGNSILREIRQVGSERVAEMIFETKQGKLNLIVELFGAGNIILVDENNIIMSPMNIQIFKDRAVRPGKEYQITRKKYNIFEIKEKELADLLKESKQESTVKALALDLGLGGIYSEELCIIKKIDKNKKPSSLSGQDVKKIFSGLKDMVSRKSEPQIVMKGKDVVDITPFGLEKYKDFESKKQESYNKALDSIITAHAVSVDKAEKQKIETKELERIRKSIEIQEKNIKKQRKDAEENQRKGEIIYEKYSVVKEILDELIKAREKHSWKEIKEKLKGHKVVKEINEKEGKIVVEI
ncbi:NFACT family protein [Thermoproteota archaeon]